MTGKELAEKGFYKVSQGGSIFITALFVNPDTWETETEVVRDYDYADGSRDNDELYYMPIDEDAREAWRKHINVIKAGDRIRVVRGRKIPLGTEAVVTRVYDWKDRYGRTQTRYAVFEDGRKTSVYNCIIID